MFRFLGTAPQARISYPSAGNVGKLFHTDEIKSHRCERITGRRSRCRRPAHWRTHDGHYVCDRRDHIVSKRGWW